MLRLDQRKAKNICDGWHLHVRNIDSIRRRNLRASGTQQHTQTRGEKKSFHVA